ncbi:GTPase Era, mitochondrial isoform X2 [Prorops nasuta]|uniref:GTPase Era, mitochondrial isoform X2 n=1 Tax=Prorops nasuta TaxID=863751 RepID=UPI0034CD2B7D
MWYGICAPNVGKSTLINQLIHRKVCGTSSKVHTTQHNMDAICTIDNTQLIFVDTPGVVSARDLKKYKMLGTFETDPAKSVKRAEIVAVIQDASNRYTRNKIDAGVIKALSIKQDIPAILIFNKVDLLKKKILLLEIIRNLTKNENRIIFQDIFMVSALSGDGIDDVRNYFLDIAKHENWEYDQYAVTNQPVDKLIAHIVRCKFLEYFIDEVPYKLVITTEHYDIQSDGGINCVVRIDCPSQHNANYLKKRRRLKVIAMEVEEQLRHVFQQMVTVKLNIQTIKKG